MADREAETRTEQSSEQPGEQSAGPPGSARSRRDRLVGWASIGAAALLAILVVVVAVLGYRSYTAHQADTARSQALTAARGAAGKVLSYDHRRLDKDFGQAKRLLAPGFAKDYAETTKTVVRPKALETEAVVSAEVMGASVVSAAEDRVVTLLFVNQTTQSNLSKDERTDLNRVRMVLERVDDTWLVSKMDAL